MSDFKKYLSVYEFDATLPGSGETIMYKPITTGQMKNLLIYEEDDDPLVIEEILDDLISSSVITEGFDIDNLYLQDRFYLLIEIRKQSKGKHFSFKITCPECGSQSLQNVDLDKLPFTPKESDVNPFVKVNENITIGLDFITRRDQKIAAGIVNQRKEEMTNMQKLANMSLIATATAIKVFITPEGEDTETSIEDKLYFLESLNQKEFKKVTDWFEKETFGIDFVTDMRCPHIDPPIRKGGPGKPCDFTEQITIPLENFFF
jgi:hypothetical protein